MTECFRNKKGYLLPMVIIYTIIAVIVGSGILVLGSMDRIEANKRLYREQAFYLAEAGVNWAYYRLKNNPAEDLNGSHTFGNVAFQISETVNGDVITIVSTGTVKGTNETTAITVSRSGGSIFSQGIFGNGNVYLGNNALINSFDSRLGPYGGSNIGSDGDIASNTQITVNNNAKVYGDATGGSILDYRDGITGTTTENISNRTLPPVVIPSDLLNLPYPVQGDPRITGNYTLLAGTFTAKGNVTITGGDFHFKNFTLNNNAVVIISNTIRFYVENDLVLNNSSSLTLPGGELYIGASGSITMVNNSVFQNSGTAADFVIYIASTEDQAFYNNSASLSAAIYAPLAEINFSNNSVFYGGVVAKEVILSNYAQLHYDVALQSADLPGDPGGGTGITFVSWTKPDWKR